MLQERAGERAFAWATVTMLRAPGRRVGAGISHNGGDLRIGCAL